MSAYLLRIPAQAAAQEVDEERVRALDRRHEVLGARVALLAARVRLDARLHPPTQPDTSQSPCTLDSGFWIVDR